MNMYVQQQTKEGQKTNKQLVAIKYSCTTGIDSLLLAQLLFDCFDRVDLLYAKKMYHSLSQLVNFVLTEI